VTSLLHRAIRKWQVARDTGGHPKVVKYLKANVEKLMKEKELEEKRTEDTPA
jgi:hypothetical protein